MTPDHDRRTTLADEVHDRPRTLNAAHELDAGERLTINTLATRLEVSATPGREALARMAAENLASYEPLVGYRATAPHPSASAARHSAGPGDRNQEFA